MAEAENTAASDPYALPLWRRLWWRTVSYSFGVWFGLVNWFRVQDRHNCVTEGPVLYLANHQSYYDPIIMGVATRYRPFYSMARATLWDTGWVGKLIDSLNAIPVDQNASDIRSIRKCIKVLQAGHALELFPEGSRTFDGNVQPFAKGIMLLIRQAKPTVVPVAIAGADRLWHRDTKKPKLFGRMLCRIGEPIPAETLLAMDADAAVQHLQDTVTQMHAELESQLKK